MPEEGSWCLEVLWVLLQVPDRAKVPRLMRCQVHAEAAPDKLSDLVREGLLSLWLAFLGDEKRAVHVGVEARQDVTPIPAQTLSHILRNLGDQILELRFGLLRWDVEQ
jgi:hypothetical protein